MSETNEPTSANVANHTLALLRRLDRRVDGIEKTMIEIVNLLARHSTKVDRSDRDIQEGFARIERELREIKSDAIISENKILDRFTETLTLSQRLDGLEERVDSVERPHPAL